MRLTAGQQAPAIQTIDFLGHAVDSRRLRGGKVALSFYRYASCPICNLRVREMIQAFPELSARGVTVLGVFQSPASSIQGYVGRQDAPFPIIADSGMALYRQFGVERSWLAMLAPATVMAALRAFRHGHAPGRIDGPIERTPADFLIDEQGRIALAHYGRSLDDHVPVSGILDWARSGSAQAA